MSQRESGYARKERDLYETPEWVTAALTPHLPRDAGIWEPACGSGKMVRALKDKGCRVAKMTDIETGADFFAWDRAAPEVGAIVTNPPYEKAAEFIKHALDLMRERAGFVCMLLRTDFDHAASRKHLFGSQPSFAKKLVLTKRIVWFEPATASPSFNHAWYIWDWQNDGQPTLAYGP